MQISNKISITFICDLCIIIKFYYTFREKMIKFIDKDYNNHLKIYHDIVLKSL